MCPQRHSAWVSITLLTLTHPETEYLLTTQLSNGDTFVFSESYSAKSAVAVPPDHQIFQHAPTFPSYLYRPNQPFRTKTTTELTIAQSLFFVQELLTPYQFPLHTAQDDLSKLGQGSSRKDTEHSSGPSSTAGAERSNVEVEHR